MSSSSVGNESYLQSLANEVRAMIIEMACKSKSVHVGPSLSCVDILVCLYFNELNIDKEHWQSRDIFVLSKAHAAMALYAVLSKRGLISQEMIDGYFQNNGTLPAHLDRHSNPAIEVSAGSLGHGFNIALGIAYGYKLKGDKRRVFTLIGDGESQEGSIWEGALFAPKFRLDNFTAILDYNNLQGYGRPTEICHFEPLKEKWEAFGWKVLMVDGHDFEQISKALKAQHEGKPKIIIAKTTKGKGVDFMQDQLKWHYYLVTDEIKRDALACLCKRA